MSTDLPGAVGVDLGEEARSPRYAVTGLREPSFGFHLSGILAANSLCTIIGIIIHRNESPSGSRGGNSEQTQQQVSVGVVLIPFRKSGWEFH